MTDANGEALIEIDVPADGRIGYTYEKGVRARIQGFLAIDYEDRLLTSQNIGKQLVAV